MASLFERCVAALVESIVRRRKPPRLTCLKEAIGCFDRVAAEIPAREADADTRRRFR